MDVHLSYTIGIPPSSFKELHLPRTLILPPMRATLHKGYPFDIRGTLHPDQTPTYQPTHKEYPPQGLPFRHSRNCTLPKHPPTNPPTRNTLHKVYPFDIHETAPYPNTHLPSPPTRNTLHKGYPFDIQGTATYPNTHLPTHP